MAVTTLKIVLLRARVVRDGHSIDARRLHLILR
jgi:hypothetical protein